MKSKDKDMIDEAGPSEGSEQIQDSENSNMQNEELPDASVEETDSIAQLELQLSEAKDKYLRLYSDFDNYKKRINRERIDLIKSASQDVMAAILPMLDDMERAIKAMDNAKDVNAVKEGVQLVYQKMKTITEGKGLKAMETTGKDFDADLHDAIANVPVDEKQKGKVIEEVEKGYYLNDKVIRHAKVVVGN